MFSANTPNVIICIAWFLRCENTRILEYGRLRRSNIMINAAALRVWIACWARHSFCCNICKTERSHAIGTRLWIVYCHKSLFFTTSSIVNQRKGNVSNRNHMLRHLDTIYHHSIKRNYYFLNWSVKAITVVVELLYPPPVLLPVQQNFSDKGILIRQGTCPTTCSHSTGGKVIQPPR